MGKTLVVDQHFLVCRQDCSSVIYKKRSETVGRFFSTVFFFAKRGRGGEFFFSSLFKKGSSDGVACVVVVN